MGYKRGLHLCVQGGKKGGGYRREESFSKAACASINITKKLHCWQQSFNTVTSLTTATPHPLDTYTHVPPAHTLSTQDSSERIAE